VHADRTRIATERNNAHALRKDIAQDQHELHREQQAAPRPQGLAAKHTVVVEDHKPAAAPARAARSSRGR